MLTTPAGTIIEILLEKTHTPERRRWLGKNFYQLYLKQQIAEHSRWVLGVQRRTVYLIPPTTNDLVWIYGLFDKPEISAVFGYEDAGVHDMLLRFPRGNMVIAIICESATRKRIGFLVMFPPVIDNWFWEFGYAIPDPADRNAFHALNTHDAVGHYMFDHVCVPVCGSRTRDDNAAAMAVIRRLGYGAVGHLEEHGQRYAFFRMDQSGWKRRCEKLQRTQPETEKGQPLFYTLPYPYQPILPASG